MPRLLIAAAAFAAFTLPAAAQDDLDFGDVTERHEMIPMRDGVRLSTSS